MKSYSSKYDLLKGLRKRSDITVPTIDDLYAIKKYKRKWGMLVSVYQEIDVDADGSEAGVYELVYDLYSDDIGDNDNWRKLTTPHDMDDPAYHRPAEEADYGKLVGSNAETGAIEFRVLKYKQDNTPDPNEADINAMWLRLIDMRLFDIVVVGDNQFWVELTSPKIT